MNLRRALERMPHLVRKDYKCNTGFRTLTAVSLAWLPPREHAESGNTSFSAERSGQTAKIHPVPHKQSQQSDGEGTACGIGMLTQAFHI